MDPRFHRRKKSKSYPVLSLCRRCLKKDRQYGRKCNAKRIELAIKKVIRCLKKGGGGKAKIGDKNKRKSQIYRDRFQRFVKRFVKRRDYTRFRAQLINSRLKSATLRAFRPLSSYKSEKIKISTKIRLLRSNIYTDTLFYRDILTCTHRLIPAARQPTT